MTSIDFRCASVDGYGDRDDIALEQDKSWNNRLLINKTRLSINKGTKMTKPDFQSIKV